MGVIKTRKDSFFGLHFDHHAYPYHGEQGKVLPFEYRDGRAYVKIDRVDIHSVIEVVK